jgi:hypothetical protein
LRMHGFAGPVVEEEFGLAPSPHLPERV